MVFNISSALARVHPSRTTQLRIFVIRFLYGCLAAAPPVMRRRPASMFPRSPSALHTVCRLSLDRSIQDAVYRYTVPISCHLARKTPTSMRRSFLLRIDRWICCGSALLLGCFALRRLHNRCIIAFKGAGFFFARSENQKAKSRPGGAVAKRRDSRARPA